jgi:CRISPR-associated protein Cas1
MDQVKASDLKTILHSKRANLYYLEHCRVLVNGGRVEYLSQQGKESQYWNIPIANTTCLLLGTGTSITQAAMRELAKAGVMVGFSGGGGTPLFTSTEAQCEVTWLLPQSEYRPTEYLQRWVSFWFDDNKRIEAAKLFQQVRLQNIEKQWLSARLQKDDQFDINKTQLCTLLMQQADALNACVTTNDILAQEAKMTKHLYKLACAATGYHSFTRAKNGTGTDFANSFLDHGNYLAYGLAATAAWVLGLPHGLAILHGKTRRGGLVFDIADLIKDALVLPQAFISGMAGDSAQEFRQKCINNFNQSNALDTMIDTVKKVAETIGSLKK